MEHTENIDAAVRHDQVSNPIMLAEKNANFACLLGFVAMTQPRVITKQLSLS